MATKNLRGEPLADVMPAHAEFIFFHGVEIGVLVGTQEQIKQSTAIYDETYPNDDKRTFADAQHAGYSPRVDPAGEPVAIYQLIVLRKVPT